MQVFLYVGFSMRNPVVGACAHLVCAVCVFCACAAFSLRLSPLCMRFRHLSSLFAPASWLSNLKLLVLELRF